MNGKQHMLVPTGLTRSPPASSDDSLASSFATSYAGVISFLAVVSEGSFAKAASRLGIGRSAVSRNVQKLEAQIDARLLLRTTRSTALTREGELFYQNCNPAVERIVQALADMRELRQGPPRGQLRVCSTTGFGRTIVAPLLSGFCTAYPDIALDFMLKDGPVEFTTERIDVAFRDGKLDDSQVVAKQLIPMQMIVCASPEYARAHGLPRSVEDLEMHRCINLRLASGRIAGWEFKVGGVSRKVVPKAVHVLNDADLMLQAVLAGHGVAQLAAYQVSELLRAKRLYACLAQYAPDDRGHYACYLSRKHLPSRIRVFIDYMTEQIRALDLQCPTEVVRPACCP
ncbi:LysR family transcriptional regulator [Paraburkholderia sp. EG304]|uniref:LysR family transcriptional regulator n=1 Tax=Paraburkholderia sp. EG304 TaxID=3237015 RepID=UPI00397B944C